MKFWKKIGITLNSNNEVLNTKTMLKDFRNSGHECHSQNVTDDKTVHRHPESKILGFHTDDDATHGHLHCDFVASIFILKMQATRSPEMFLSYHITTQRYNSDHDLGTQNVITH
jgi:hypothetical protein